MKAEIQQLQDTVRLLREERKQMISQEQHFEKLREHEVLFLESLRLAESRSRNDFKDSKRNSLGFNNEGSRRGTIPQSPSDFGLMSSSKMPISWHHEDSLGEEEVKNQMQGLEKKIDELIQENESILRENQDLKDLSLSIINSTRKVNSCCFCGNYQYSSNKPGLESKASTKEETFSSRDREIVDLVQSIEDRFRDERKELKERVVYLEEEMSKLRKNRTAEQSAAKRPIANGEFHGELDEAYSTIDRLEKENRLLLTRIDQLSAESSRNREDTGLLYSIIEQKNKAQNELLRERSLDLAQNSYRSHDNGG
jgi:hypothetical protein